MISGEAAAELQATGEGAFALKGALTYASAPSLWRQGKRIFHGGGDATVDLARVTQGDSAGLALLISWLQEAERRKVELRFLNIPKQLLLIARTSRVIRLLPL